MDSFIKPFIYKGKTTILTVEKSVKNSGLKCGEKVDKWIKKFIYFYNLKKSKIKKRKRKLSTYFFHNVDRISPTFGKNFNAFY